MEYGTFHWRCSVRSLVAGLFVVAAWGFVACNSSGLSNQPRATSSQLACLDENGDQQLNASDAANPSSIPDFNGDRSHDEKDAVFFSGVDVALDAAGLPDICGGDSELGPEYEVAHGYFKPAEVSCDANAHPVLLVGIGGGVKDLTDKGDAAGVRSIIGGLQKSYKSRDVETIAVIAGPAMLGALQANTSMEQWMTNAVRIYFDRYPCIRVVLVGHSHGAVTGDVIAAALEGEYGERFIEVVELDRSEFAYGGDTQSKPTVVHVFSIFESNSDALSGVPYADAANAEVWDASSEMGPEKGDKGGEMKPVTHTTIDNSPAVKERIIDEVMSRS